jgi:cell division protein FtsL
MKNIFKSPIYKIIVVALLIYAVYIMYNQQIKLNNYANEKQYYEEQIEDLNAQKEELTAEKENVNSPEYIEEIAREKLDMYLPNEKVFVDMSK